VIANPRHRSDTATWARLAGLVLLACLIGLRVVDPTPVAGLRLAAFDLLQRLHPREYTQVPVTILDIDDASLAEIGQWPWPRTRLAEVVQAADKAGAAGVAFDILLAEADRLSPAQMALGNTALPLETRAALVALPDNDEILATAIEGRPVVLGMASRRGGQGPAMPPGTAPLQPVPHAILGQDPAPWILDFPGAIRSLPELSQAATGEGVITVLPDFDGVFRRMPLAVRIEGQYRLSLVTELLRVASGNAPFTLRTNAAGIEGVGIARQMITTDRDGTVWPWLGHTRPERFIPAADLLADRVPEGRLKGHLVLLGTSAIGLEDFRPTALGVPMAGVEIHAQLLETILSGAMLTRPNYAIGAELTLGVGTGLAILALAPMAPALWLAVASFGIVLGLGALSYVSFATDKLLIDVTWPALTALAMLILMTSANYLREEHRRRQIRAAFGQYVSPELVAQLSDRDADLRLGGETRELTLLFSDMRGFASVSEAYGADAQGLTQLMNALLTALSKPILAQGGTIDKFMGDAVMAFWNAPLPHDDAPGAACAAALEMRRAIRQLNRDRQKAATLTGAQADPLRVGIGINTGLCVVGNMGSDARFDYTALGDAVNLASRLQGQTRYYGVDVLLGDDTRRAVEGRFATLELDLVRVRGKTQSARVHALIGDSALAQTPAFAKLRENCARMRQAYRNGQVAKGRAAADEMLRDARALTLDLETFVALYQARFDQLQATPPQSDWDGVTELS